MFQNEDLSSHLQTKSSISARSLVIAEWNLNIGTNIERVGNYRYRPLAGVQDKYGLVSGTYDENDEGFLYTNATDADVVLDGTYDEEDSLTLLKSSRDKEASLFSLENCFERFRPRSGINKARYGVNTKYLNYSNYEMNTSPRYYMPDKNDKFKYWSSFRSEPFYKYEYSNGNVQFGSDETFIDNTFGNNLVSKAGALSGAKERGIASQTIGDKNYIDDASPFVKYKESIPANRIVIKMQTNVGSASLNQLTTSARTSKNPFYGYKNSTVPERWRVQYLEDNSWIDAAVFDEYSVRSDGTNIVNSDGYVELSYGLIIPDNYKSSFNFISIISSDSLLPESANDGDSFLLIENESSVGKFFTWSNTGYFTWIPEYDWSLHEEDISNSSNFVSELINTPGFLKGFKQEYREFKFISGLRVVVETMVRQGSSFDLIELSPRMTVDLSSMTSQFSVSKTASDLGVSGLPVGQLLASTGNLELFDSEDAFNPNNSDSLISSFGSQNLQIKMYEIIDDVEGRSIYVPLKTLYSEGYPKLSSKSRAVSLELRDFMFYLETITAPEILIPSVSLSYAISLLLDGVGFSNYNFYRVSNESDPIIPFFFVDPTLNVAEVLQQLAVSTQTAMFFDEYNNFICMSKNYMMPSEEDRETDIILYGSNDFSNSGVVRNGSTKESLANIIEIASQSKEIYNGGKITYTTRYIQKSISSIKQAYNLDKQKNWVYKPALLWEVTASQNPKSSNEQETTSEAYSLSAIPLNSDLTAEPPFVVNYQMSNNVMDLGEAVYWLGRYNGYFYANGEIIKFDAVEYSVTGIQDPLWITSLSDYQNYFSKIPFNGKMYPTGRIRIYAEPNHEVVLGETRMSNGEVAKHGRAQFGTKITDHFAGIDPYWKSADNVRGMSMDSRFLFGSEEFDLETFPSGVAGEYISGSLSNSKAKRSSRTDVIKNFLSSSYTSETGADDDLSEMVQASALVFEGPSFSIEEEPVNFMSYVTKKISDSQSSYKHFGTRMRVIGKVESDESNWQSPAGSATIYNISSSNPEDIARIDGGGGGLGVLINPKTNEGYYFEIIAMNSKALEDYDGYGFKVSNIFFYKIDKNNTEAGLAAPIKLWSGLSNIIVDSGSFTGQERVFAQEVQTVYDLAVEYENIGTRRRFYLFLNGTQIATVDDINPTKEEEHDNVALFIRGSSRCIFENIYAIENNYSKNSNLAIEPVVSRAFSSNQINTNESFNKYSISGLVQSTYLSGISPADVPRYNIYYDEFGTIMREAAYFNIKYDKAFPALYAKMSPTINKLRGYTISGFFAGSYGAEFLIFNSTDTAIVLDDSSGNYLKIQGITFTQESPHELTVDEYFDKKSSILDRQIKTDSNISSPLAFKDRYKDIKLSRISHGLKEFSIDADYLQDQDSANELMGWLTDKIMKERISLGIKIFSNPMIQLGDIVEIEYSNEGVPAVSETSKRFVVYNIEYNRSSQGPDMTIYVSEV